MPEIKTIAPKTPKDDDRPSDPAKQVQKELDQIADEAAGKAAREEQDYDADHGIFTK
ncbi:MAG TPA: hypothetical protein VHU89_08130 [Acidobacteriaceae bacterium]|jgi:hypothetical protein|nr:hypothetical protein [Acidobacteriaceae bacterium]